MSDTKPTGRPRGASKYKPEYCKWIVTFMRDGGSLVEFAGEVEVTPATIYNWARNHAEFGEALELAKTFGEAYWERRLRTDLMLSKDVNAPLVKLYLANRFGWSDKQEIKQDVTSSDGSMSPPTRIELVAPGLNEQHGKG